MKKILSLKQVWSKRVNYLLCSTLTLLLLLACHSNMSIPQPGASPTPQPSVSPVATATPLATASPEPSPSADDFDLEASFKAFYASGKCTRQSEAFNSRLSEEAA